MTSIIRIIAAVTLIIGAGLVHGAWTNRWRPSQALVARAARLDSVPMVIGAWTGEPYAMSQRTLVAAGAVNHLARRYTNAGRGITMSVLLLCGLPGDISTHTPEACYPGAGYTLGDITVSTRSYGSPERQAEFRTALATRGGTSPSVLRIYWAWNAAGGWRAPTDARWQFAAEPALCKLYVIRETAGIREDPADDACNDFLTALLPELDRSVFAPVTGVRENQD
jgi:hypothetical protein